MKETLHEFQTGLQIGGRIVMNLRYADDISSRWPLRRQNYRSCWIALTESAVNAAYSSASTRPR